MAVSSGSAVSWSTAYGQELHQGAGNVFRVENKDRKGSTVRRHKRIKKLRNSRYSVQSAADNETEVLMELWMNDLDSHMRNLRQWIRAEVRKKSPCAWGLSILGETLHYLSAENIAFPSFDTNYWITPIKVKDLASTTIQLTGIPANARYYSMQTYTLDDQFSSVVGALADVNITLADDGSYTILINDGQDTGDPQVNSMRGLPDGSNDGIIVLMYRTYLPVPLTSPAGGVALPLISIQNDLKGDGGELAAWDYCTEAEPTIEIQPLPDYKTKVQISRLPEGIEYFRSPGRSTPFPNEDVSYRK
jgi:hypothetical protein